MNCGEISQEGKALWVIKNDQSFIPFITGALYLLLFAKVDKSTIHHLRAFRYSHKTTGLNAFQSVTYSKKFCSFCYCGTSAAQNKHKSFNLRGK